MRGVRDRDAALAADVEAFVARLRAATSFSGVVAGSSNQVEFYPDLGYVLVVLGNTDSGTEEIAAHVRDQLTSSVPAEPSQTIEK